MITMMTIDLFTDITHYQQFFVFFKSTKTTLVHSSIYHAEFSKSLKFYKHPLQTKNIGPKTYKEMHAREKALLPGIYFLFD